MRWRNLSLIFCLLCRHGALDVGRRCKTIRFAVRFATFVVLLLWRDEFPKAFYAQKSIRQKSLHSPTSWMLRHVCAMSSVRTGPARGQKANRMRPSFDIALIFH